jgi:hypothetical protein
LTGCDYCQHLSQRCTFNAKDYASPTHSRRRRPPKGQCAQLTWQFTAVTTQTTHLFYGVTCSNHDAVAPLLTPHSLTHTRNKAQCIAAANHVHMQQGTTPFLCTRCRPPHTDMFVCAVLCSAV